MVETSPKKRSLMPLIFLVLVFALPPLASWILYLNPQWLPTGRSNQGVLVQPPRPVDGIKLFTPRGEQLVWTDLNDKWILVVIGSGECNGDCMERLFQVRQIRRALGAQRQRVERLLILLPQTERPTPVLPSLEGNEGVRVGVVQAEDAAGVEALFDVQGLTPDGRVFVIDPRRMLMMVHDTNVMTSKQILKDLEKLLKASENWKTGSQ